MTTPLTSPQELSELLTRQDRARPTVLDVRWDLGGGADVRGFAAGHVPGSLFCDLEEVLTGPLAADGSGGRHPLPATGAVRAWLAGHRIEDDTPVVLLDAGHGAGAARAWWVLRDAGLQDVRVLDGGLAAWQEAGLPVETGPPPAPRPGRNPGAGHPEDPPGEPAPHVLPLRTASDLEQGLPRNEVLLDARPARRYAGEDLGPDPVGGHVPGAVNLPVGSLYADGRLREVETVRARFAAAGVGADTPVVVSCGSGITACQLALAHRQVFPGAPEPQLYAGSFSDWISDPRRPLAHGDQPGALPGRPGG